MPGREYAGGSCSRRRYSVSAEESTAAIVLRARDYSESDRIVTLLTREFGKLSGIAKGAKASRRRFERKLEPFSHVNLFFRRRPQGQLVFITRAEPGESMPPALEDDLAKIALGSYMLELADALTSEEAEAAEERREVESRPPRNGTRQVVPCSKRGESDHNGSTCASGNPLRNIVE